MHLSQRLARVVLSSIVAISSHGCAASSGAPGTAAPTPQALTEPLALQTPEALEREASRLDRWAVTAVTSPAVAITRLARLLDLFDAARFTGNPAIRDLFWAQFPTRTGPRRGGAASRDALEVLLQAAWAAEQQFPDLAPEDADFLAEFIALISIDLFVPESREELELQRDSLDRVWREAPAEILDNVLWRRYDLVRGVCEAVIRAPRADRRLLAVHALYATTTDVNPWLAPVTDHARPPWPTAETLLTPMHDALDALGDIPQWSAIATSVASSSSALTDACARAYPPPPDPGWTLPEYPVGVGQSHDGSAMVRLDDGLVVVQPGTPDERRFRADDHALDPILDAALGPLLAADGRASLLIAAAPELPSPQLARVIDRSLQAGAASLQFAVHEPRLDNEGHVLATLSVPVIDPASPAPGARAFAASPVKMYLTGRGLDIDVEGAPLARQLAPGQATATEIDRVLRAYPRLKTFRLWLSDDLQYRQITDFLAIVRQAGGRAPPVVGLSLQDPGRAAPTRRGLARAQRRLNDRVARNVRTPPDLRQPYPLAGTDQTRLEAFVSRLTTCLPDLRQTPRRDVTLQLRFEEGHVVASDFQGLDRLHTPVFDSCVAATLETFRIRGHRERLAIEVRWPQRAFRPVRDP